MEDGLTFSVGSIENIYATVIDKTMECYRRLYDIEND